VEEGRGLGVLTGVVDDDSRRRGAVLAS